MPDLFSGMFCDPVKSLTGDVTFKKYYKFTTGFAKVFLYSVNYTYVGSQAISPSAHLCFSPFKCSVAKEWGCKCWALKIAHFIVLLCAGQCDSFLYRGDPFHVLFYIK